MARIAELTLLDDDGEQSEINVFIHGYKALGSPEQFAAAAELILAARPAGPVYFLHWKAGDWSTTRAVIAARSAYRAARVAKLTNPWSYVIDVGLLAATEIAQFKLMERRSTELGKNLKRHLCGIPGAKSRPINLIGHSLGARVIHSALANEDWSDYQFNDCVFLAGAADLNADNWPQCLAQIAGRLFNGYSKNDAVLSITPDLRRRVGNYPMPDVWIDGQNKIVNKNCGRTTHTEYWNRLEFLLPKVWEGYRRKPAEEDE
jgi:hypothetical protein